MKKSGLADSPFFAPTPEKQEERARPFTQPGVKKKNREAARNTDETNETGQPDNHGTTQPSDHGSKQPRDHDTTVSRYHDTVIEVIRRAVNELGKEAATHRFTPEEKKALADLLYTYKNQGIRTSENEITRIAVNFIIHDYKENGEESILARALKALNE